MIKAIASDGGQSRRRRRLVTEIGRCGGWEDGTVANQARCVSGIARPELVPGAGNLTMSGLAFDSDALPQFFLVFKSCGYLRLQVLYEFLGRIAKAAHRHDREEQFRRKGRCDQENGRWLRARVRRRAKAVAFPEA